MPVQHDGNALVERHRVAFNQRIGTVHRTYHDVADAGDTATVDGEAATDLDHGAAMGGRITQAANRAHHRLLLSLRGQ